MTGTGAMANKGCWRSQLGGGGASLRCAPGALRFGLSLGWEGVRLVHFFSLGRGCANALQEAGRDRVAYPQRETQRPMNARDTSASHRGNVGWENDGGPPSVGNIPQPLANKNPSLIWGEDGQRRYPISVPYIFGISPRITVETMSGKIK